MHGPYPGELRTRVIDFVEEGGSRREAAEQVDVSVSSAIRWVQRFRENGTSEPMPSGGSTSPLENHSRQITHDGRAFDQLATHVRSFVAAHLPRRPPREDLHHSDSNRWSRGGAPGPQMTPVL